MPNTSITFPASPAVNQQYTYGTTTYVWTGTSWMTYIDSASLMPTNPAAMTRQQFSGTGSQTVFTLAADPGALGNGTHIYINGVYQQKATYTTVTTTLTFSSAPPLGTNNIEVVSFVLSSVGTTDSALVTYLPSGTGAVTRTTQSKMRDTVSVKDFGAVGDGVTDDSLALENARIAAKDQKKPLYIPTGTYCFNELTIRASPAGYGFYISNADGQEIYGDGVERTILKNTSATGAGLRCASGYMNVHDLTIDNNNSTGSAYKHGGQYSSATNITIKNQGGSSYACVVDGSTLSNLSHINLINCTYGISVAATTPTQYITFNNCSVEPSSGTALYVGSSSRISFNQFYIEPTNTAANMIEYIVLNGAQNTTFNDFSCEIASGTLTSNAYFTLTNCKSISFVNCKLNINDLASAKSVFTINSCNGVSFINTYFVLTKATMTMVETITAMSYNIGMYHTNTLLTLVATGFKNTFVNTYLTIDQWVDHNNVSSHVINAVNCSIKNMTTDIAITTRAAQLLLDCTGTISGSGATTATKINCNSGASTNIQNISGLNFLAIQSASADANTLDDYEEGTWTPTFTNLTVVGTPTYYAGYIKIGKIVFCTVRIISSTTTASTANSTYLTVPFVNGTIPSTCQAVNTSTKASYGIGYVDTYCYTPTWAAVADVTISFTYSTAT